MNRYYGSMGQQSSNTEAKTLLEDSITVTEESQKVGV